MPSSTNCVLPREACPGRSKQLTERERTEGVQLIEALPEPIANVTKAIRTGQVTGWPAGWDKAENETTQLAYKVAKFTSILQSILNKTKPLTEADLHYVHYAAAAPASDSSEIPMPDVGDSSDSDGADELDGDTYFPPITTVTIFNKEDISKP
ncbi:hypothetical protein B0H19DRAFT_1272851 [Mycena capillaripes]|nr:hypothetical protein B0H19DRAFT_1272851 [Mycena capillaripes]